MKFRGNEQAGGLAPTAIFALFAFLTEANINMGYSNKINIFGNR
jgi:hypothetical protein